MLKSDYIRREHENQLLLQGYICVSEKSGVQTWVDMLGQGVDIQHLVFNYPLFVDEFGALTPGDAKAQGAIYFLVPHPKRARPMETTWVSKAIASSRSRTGDLPM